MSYNKALYFSQNATTFVMNLPVAYNLLLHLIELITLVSRMYFVVSCGSKLLRITDRGAVSLSSSSTLNRHSVRLGTLFFFIRILFSRARLNILIFPPILGCKYSCIILNNSL